MRIRLAKPSDMDQLADVHWVCSREQANGFMFKLGKRFLRQYYRVLLTEENTVVICAIADDGRIVGFASGSLDAAEHLVVLKRNRFRLLWAALPALVRNPALINGLFSRQRSRSAEEGGYIVLSGARGEYWAWIPTARSAGAAIGLFQKWLSLMRLLGAQEVRFEVDRGDGNVEQIHTMLGARIVKELVTPDGKPRLVMEYVFGH